jgi:hypothetical protein
MLVDMASSNLSALKVLLTDKSRAFAALALMRYLFRSGW